MAGEGGKKRFPKIKMNAQKSPVRSALKPNANLTTPLLRPVRPELIHQEHIAAGDADFPDKGSEGSSPRAVNKISCSF